MTEQEDEQKQQKESVSKAKDDAIIILNGTKDNALNDIIAGKNSALFDIATVKNEAVASLNSAKAEALAKIKTDKDEAIVSINSAKTAALGCIRSAQKSFVLVVSIILLLAVAAFVYSFLPDHLALKQPVNWKQVVITVVPELILGTICIAVLITSRREDD